MAVSKIPTDHADHDELRIVAYAAGDLSGSELTMATELVASCATCARLADDLPLIRAATRRLPAPERTRDFRLTTADAARLRPGGWRRYLGSLAGPRFAFTQPLAAGLATLGLIGVLLATLPAGLGGFSASTGSSNVEGAPETSGDRVAAPAEAQPSGEAGAAGAADLAPSLTAPEPAPSSGAAALLPSGSPPSEQPVASADAGGSATAPDAAGSTEAQKDLASGTSADGTTGTGPSPLLAVSALLLVGGLGLLALRLGARRIAAV
jgi:hypothetical protein